MKKHKRERQDKVAAIAAKSDAEIDLSDMPEVLDWSGAEIGKFYRPAKKPATLRLDGDVIEWLKSFGPGYQTRVNGLCVMPWIRRIRNIVEPVDEGPGLGAVQIWL
jgi:uncharacterized protein (DUF4415 family)